MMTRGLAVLCFSAILAGALACGEFDEGADEGEPTGAVLTLELPSGSDVEYIKYSVYERTCPPPKYPYGVGEVEDMTGRVVKETVAVKEMTLPARLSEFSRRPLHEDSMHRFSDLFVLLPAGCYQIHMRPMKTPTEESLQCLAVHLTLEVFKGSITEDLLISQCEVP